MDFLLFEINILRIPSFFVFVFFFFAITNDHKTNKRHREVSGLGCIKFIASVCTISVCGTGCATLLDGSTVPLGESLGHCAKELVEGDVSLGSEFVGEVDGAHHENALGQDLWMAQSCFC